jgi:hypothetical protein
MPTPDTRLCPYMHIRLPHAIFDPTPRFRGAAPFLSLDPHTKNPPKLELLYVHTVFTPRTVPSTLST